MGDQKYSRRSRVPLTVHAAVREQLLLLLAQRLHWHFIRPLSSITYLNIWYEYTTFYYGFKITGSMFY
jgi:hypothetical protein